VTVSMDRFEPPGWLDESGLCRSCGERVELSELSEISGYCLRCAWIEDLDNDEETMNKKKDIK